MEIDDMYEHAGYYRGGDFPTQGMTFQPAPEQTYVTQRGIAYDPATGEQMIAKAGGVGTTALIPAAAAVAPAVARSWPAVVGWLGRIFPWLAGGAGVAELTGATDFIDFPWEQTRQGVEAFGGGMDMIRRAQFGGGVMQTPPSSIVAKSWNGIGGSRFYLLRNGRVVVQKANGVMKLVKRPRMIHMKASNPRLGDVAKAARTIKKTKTALNRLKF